MKGKEVKGSMELEGDHITESFRQMKNLGNFEEKME